VHRKFTRFKEFLFSVHEANTYHMSDNLLKNSQRTLSALLANTPIILAPQSGATCVSPHQLEEDEEFDPRSALLVLIRSAKSK
jgi:hypothetical protein